MSEPLHRRLQAAVDGWLDVELDDVRMTAPGGRICRFECQGDPEIDSQGPKLRSEAHLLDNITILITIYINILIADYPRILRIGSDRIDTHQGGNPHPTDRSQCA